jgi:N4-gp56 family major capsid protein
MIWKLNLHLFAANTNVTTDAGLSDEMKTFYSDYLIDLAEPYLVHDQFGQKHPIPKNGGKSIEFRKYSPLAKALTPLTEGVTPDGNKLNMGVITATVAQYGDYIVLSDVLLLTAIDNNLVQATELLASQAGRTLDTITREVLQGGTNVMYAQGGVSRAALAYTNATTNNNVTFDDIRKCVRALKVQNTPKIKGSYVAIVHPDVAYDIMSDSRWVNVKTYSDPEGIYEGEIGKIEGVRFVETTEAKIFHAADLTADSRTLSVKTTSSSSTTLAVKEKITAADATALAGRQFTVDGVAYTIASATAGAAGSASLTLSASASLTQNKVLYPAGAGANGRDVYGTLILGENAYGVTEVSGGGLQHIVKQLGYGDDPLNQRASCGWKAIKVAERLVEEYMIRLESTSSFDDAPEN